MLDLVIKSKEVKTPEFRDYGNAAPQESRPQRYDVEILKKMLENAISNQKSSQGWLDNSVARGFNDARIEQDAIRLGRHTAAVRFLAALIENDGVLNANFKSFDKGWVGLDKMSYSAAAGADTSWWTRGT